MGKIKLTDVQTENIKKYRKTLKSYIDCVIEGSNTKFDPQRDQVELEEDCTEIIIKNRKRQVKNILKFK